MGAGLFKKQLPCIRHMMDVIAQNREDFMSIQKIRIKFGRITEAGGRDWIRCIMNQSILGWQSLIEQLQGGGKLVFKILRPLQIRHCTDALYIVAEQQIQIIQIVGGREATIWCCIYDKAV